MPEYLKIEDVKLYEALQMGDCGLSQGSAQEVVARLHLQGLVIGRLVEVRTDILQRTIRGFAKDEYAVDALMRAVKNYVKDNPIQDEDAMRTPAAPPPLNPQSPWGNPPSKEAVNRAKRIIDRWKNGLSTEPAPKPAKSPWARDLDPC